MEECIINRKVLLDSIVKVIELFNHTIATGDEGDLFTKRCPIDLLNRDISKEAYRTLTFPKSRSKSHLLRRMDFWIELIFSISEYFHSYPNLNLSNLKIMIHNTDIKVFKKWSVYLEMYE